MKKKSKVLRVFTSSVSIGLLKGQLKYMKQQGMDVCVASGEPFNIIDIAAAQEEVEAFKLKHLTRPVSIVQDFLALFEMARLIRKIKPDIIHTHTPKAGTVGMLAAWITRVPIRLHTVAGMPLLVHKGIKRRILNFVERTTYMCATKVYPNSHALKDIIIKEKLAPAHKLDVLANGSSNGINTDYFSPSHFTNKETGKLREELNISKSDFVFIFVVRLVRDKGVNELISAFSRLKEKNIKLLLIGTFEEELDPLLPETLHEIKNNQNIISLGWQDDVRPYYAISDALVFPSYREGFPNVVMQAGAMGLPSIVTDINGCNEIIIEKENGVIISPQNKEQLYDAMLYFLENIEEVQRMAKNSRGLITVRYEQHIVWEAVLKEYQKLKKTDDE